MNRNEQRPTVLMMTEAECVCLLAGETLGRLVYDNGLLPTYALVPYRMHGRALIFTTNSDIHGTSVRQQHSKPYVSLHVDHFENATRSGWSILLTGVCNPLPPDVARAAAMHPNPVSGAMSYQLTIQTISGRRLEQAKPASGPAPRIPGRRAWASEPELADR